MTNIIKLSSDAVLDRQDQNQLPTDVIKAASLESDIDLNQSVPKGIILVKDEPMLSILIKFFTWIMIMAIFILILIYFSDYFARKPMPSSCISAYDTIYYKLKNKTEHPVRYVNSGLYD